MYSYVNETLFKKSLVGVATANSKLSAKGAVRRSGPLTPRSAAILERSGKIVRKQRFVRLHLILHSQVVF
jgi:hypothetical protein